MSSRRLIKIPDSYSERVFLSQDETEDITYGDIDELIPEDVALQIYRKVILCLCSQTSACVAGFVALQQAGSIPMMVNRDISVESMNELITSYEIKYCWMPDAMLDSMPATSRSEVFRFRDYVLIDYYSCGEERTSNEIDLTVHPDLAMLLATSGSTGEKKFVRLSKTNILKGIDLVLLLTGFNENDTGLVYLPVEHCFTISLIHTIYTMGGKLVCAPGGVMELATPGFFDRYRISVLISVTFIINLLMRAGFFKNSHPSLRIITNGAGATPIEIQDFLNEYMRKQGGVMIPTYGQTEVTIVGSAVPPEYVDRIYNSIGKPVGDIEMSIADADADGIGELVIKSAAVMMGYAYGRDDLMKGSVTDNILYTGDLAMKDDEGFYFIKGRIARFAKINSKRISLQMVEDELAEAFPEEEFAVVSNDKIISVMTTCEVNRYSEIKQKVEELSGVHTYMVECSYCNQIPRTEAGKVQYYLIEKELYG